MFSINFYIMDSRSFSQTDRLVELDTTEIAVPYGADHVPVPEQRYRDVAKLRREVCRTRKLMNFRQI